MLSSVIVLLLQTVVQAQTLTVTPKSTIMAAVAQAKPGDVIEVAPGTYNESVVIDTPNVKLLGKIEKGQWPVLDGKNLLSDGVISSGNNFHIENFKVMNYRGNGVTTQGGDNIVLRRLIVEKTGIYGIYPTRGSNILVEESIISGIADAGIYVGMCTHTEVRRNELYENVAGIEIENSSHVIVEDNNVHNNAGGILVFTLPGLPVKDGRSTIVRNNFVHENNHKNFAPQGAVVGVVPSGSGIILLAAKETTIEKNVIRGNKAGGILIADLSFIEDSTSSKDPELNPRFEYNRVLDNFFSDNGNEPHGKVRLMLGLLKFRLKSADVVAHGEGKGNCVTKGIRGEVVLTKDFTDCDPKATTKGITTVFQKDLDKVHRPKFTSLGEKVFGTVCSGCHGVGIKLIGPAVEELQKKYKDNPKGIAEFAFAPSKLRSGFMSMPPQAHLGKERLAAAADWILKLQKRK